MPGSNSWKESSGQETDFDVVSIEHSVTVSNPTDRSSELNLTQMSIRSDRLGLFNFDSFSSLVQKITHRGISVEISQKLKTRAN